MIGGQSAWSGVDAVMLCTMYIVCCCCHFRWWL